MSKSSVSVIIIAALTSGCVYLSVAQDAIPLQHHIFVLFVAAYSLFANFYICRSAGSYYKPLRRASAGPLKTVRTLFPFTFLLSLLTPTLLLVLAPTCGVRPPDSMLFAILAPHLYLVMVQIVFETIGFLFADRALVYVRLGLTTAFISYRLPVLFEWYSRSLEWSRTAEAQALPPYAPAVTYTAAVLNIVYWMFGLFCFMMLYCIPALVKRPQLISPAKQSAPVRQPPPANQMT